MSQNDRTLTSRYEWKYFVPASLLPSIRAMSRPFVRPDRFARTQPGNRYPIVSLYLDGDGYELYRTTVEGHLNRFKLRVRAYDDDPGYDDDDDDDDDGREGMNDEYENKYGN